MNFESIAGKYPGERQTVAKLSELLSSHRGQKAEFTLNRLCDLLEPNSREALALILGDLTRNGEMRLIIRVVSPSNQGGIRDFSSLDDIPEMIFDWRADSEVPVTSENLRVIYESV